MINKGLIDSDKTDTDDPVCLTIYEDHLTIELFQKPHEQHQDGI